MIFALLLLAAVAAAQCNNPVFNSMQFPKLFFSCYHQASNIGECMFNSTDSCSALCVQQAASCVEANCSPLCGDDVPSAECSSCSNMHCAFALQTCVGQAYTDFSCGFFCTEEYWVFPVVLAAASLAGVLLCVASYVCCMKCCCGGGGKDVQGEEITKYNSPPKGTGVDDTINLYMRRNVLSTKRKDVESLQQDEGDFEATNPVFAHEQAASTVASAQRASLVMRQAAASLRTSLTNKRTAESNVRVSQLPQGFRQSIQVGLTPDMIFDMDTAQSMKQANRNRASVSVPTRVIQSHKFATMMGVNEADLNKPYSEPVTERVERMAKVANAQGINVGGSTAGLGPQIAHQFTLNQRARQEREEERIREEIRQQSLQEKKQAQQHNSMKLHQSLKRESAPAAPPANRLKQFLQENS